MELLKDFMDINNSFKRVLVPGSATGGTLVDNDEDYPKDPLLFKEEAEGGLDYAKEAQEEEDRAWLEDNIESCNDDASSVRGYAASSVRGYAASSVRGYAASSVRSYATSSVRGYGEIDESLSLCGFAHPAQQEEALKVYETYDFSHRVPQELPIEAFKEKILKIMEAYPVCVIQGATGCGKSTQVPQYILDHCRSQFKPCNIVVTQPRRLAAITVAKRVCAERKWDIGGIVGYQVGLNTCTSPDTRLTFCTTGVLLQKLVTERSVVKYSHIILDEVHERDEDMDFLMMIVRKLIRQSASDTKVILMSATLDPDKFCRYFGSMGIQGDTFPAPLIDLDQDRKKKHRFQVNTYYLTDLNVLGPLPDINYDEPGIPSETFDLAFKLVQGFDSLEKKSKISERGAVLAFLPGIHEIDEFYNILNRKGVSNKWWIRPLNSTITTNEQELVFLKPPRGHRKIILSTNIAESSLTVPDIVYVIDFCLTKQLICDPTTNFCSLQISWASKTNCIQRAGRAGRVRDGRVYRLVPQVFYEQYMDPDLPPEMLRCPLDRTILLAKLLNMGPPKHLLGLCMDPPDLTNIRSTILILKEAGALLKTIGGRIDKEDGDITYLGTIMAKLPLDIHVSKLIMLGYLFNVLEECIIMGAALSLKNMFIAPFREELAAFKSRLTWANGSCSDCISFLFAYTVWQNQRAAGFPSEQGETVWARRAFMQLSSLKEVHTLVKEIQHRLGTLNIKPLTGVDVVQWTDPEKFMVWRFVIAGAFYPNYFVRSGQGGQVNEKDAVRQVVGRDPFNTVYLEGLPLDQPGELYVRRIKEALSECGANMRVSFEGTSKIYVQFPQPVRVKEQPLMSEIPGKVCLPVYRAVKLRQVKEPITLHIMESAKAMARARSLGLMCSREGSAWWTSKKENKEDECLMPVLPSIDTSCIYFCITHVEDPGCFWAHLTVTRDCDRAPDEREIIVRMLNSNPAKNLVSLCSTPVHGKVYAASEELQSWSTPYFRCKVLATRIRDHLAKVFFIDSGRTAEVPFSRMREFGEKLIEEGILKIPPQAFECCLSEVRPVVLLDAHGGWCKEAKDALITIKTKCNVFGKIYSVVHGVVNLEVYGDNRLPFEDASPFESVNQYFIRKQWAEPKEESYQSKCNHELRETAANLRMEVNPEQLEQERQYECTKDWLPSKPDPDLPSDRECYKWITLKGPFSPLEMRLFALTHIGVSRAVQVDYLSVNSVLLDTDPEDPHERMLVACNVGENADHSKLNLRYTTMLPNIHGLSALICLVFAPTAELRVNKERTRFIGALCGLGVHPDTKRPLFPDHDMEIVFDTKITLDDLQDVNNLRFWMTQGLLSDDDFSADDCGTRSPAYIQGKVREYFRKLLSTQRPSQEVEMFPRPYMWKQVNENHLRPPSHGNGPDRGVYQLHYGVELLDEPEPNVMDHLTKLNDIAKGKIPWVDEIDCKVCNITSKNIRMLQMHVATQQHREKEENIRASMMARLYFQ